MTKSESEDAVLTLQRLGLRSIAVFKLGVAQFHVRCYYGGEWKLFLTLDDVQAFVLQVVSVNLNPRLIS